MRLMESVPSSSWLDAGTGAGEDVVADVDAVTDVADALGEVRPEICAHALFKAAPIVLKCRSSVSSHSSFPFHTT